MLNTVNISTNKTSMENEPEQEYHVNSGFVNKLRSKFAQLENNSNRIVLSKRSASVENLLSESAKASSGYISNYRNRHGSANRSSNDDTNLNSQRTSNVILRKTAPQGHKKPVRINSNEGLIQTERPRSNEFLFKSSEKQDLPIEKGSNRSNHVIRSVKPPLPKKNDAKRVIRNSATDYHAPKIEHHDWTIAPDLEKVGRDNIIIIESSAPLEKTEKPKEKTQIDHEETDDVFHRDKPLKENKNNEDELPKPHTVSAFRSFFEKANKATDTLRGWQGHSPTRKSADSDKGSPKVCSPVNSPRLPFEKVGDDSVFTLTADKGPDMSLSQRQASVNKSSVVTSPSNSSEFVPDIDTTPTSIQKSREIFQKNDNELSEKLNVRRSSIDSGKINFKDAEQNTSHTLTPLQSMTEVFNSKDVKREKSNRPKPVVLARNSKEFTGSNHVSEIEVSHKSIPKDTIELKHERERKSSSSYEEGADKDDKVLVIDDKSKTKKSQANQNITQNDDVLNESLVKPSKKKSGTISPRKTKIFDSANMVKKDRDPPKSPVSTVPPSVPGKPVISPETVKTAVEDVKEETKMEVTPVRPARSKKSQGSKLPNSGSTPLNTNIVKNDSKSHNDTRSPKTNKPEPVFPEPKSVDVPVKKVVPSNALEAGENPVSGRSSFLASRLKKPENENSQLKTSAGHLTNGASPSPIPRKRQAPARPVENGFIASSGDVEMKDKEQIPPELPKTPEPKLPSSNIDDIIKRKKKPQSSAKMVFDSSKMTNKRKDPLKRKPQRKTLQELNENITFDSSPVPRLDLSSITGEKQETEYQEGYIPTVIKPCDFKFIGEGVVLEKNPLKKTKKSKVKISFDDHATTTFEYEGEESALENYLQEHPEEREEVQRQEEDVATHSAEELLHDSPRAPDPDVSAMKSNTVIGSSGALTSYKSKIQTQEFQFGMNLEPEEPQYDYREAEEEVDENSMQLLPADENDLDTFSAEVGKADMLF